MHYLTMVFVEDEVGLTPEKAERKACDLLEPYDEGNHRLVTFTREDLIDDQKAYIESIRTGVYQRYLDDPETFKGDVRPEYFNFVSEEFPKKLTMSDEELYRERLGWFGEDEINEDGEVEVWGNPEGRYDWYTIGGRWDKPLRLPDGQKTNAARVKEVAFGFDTDAFLEHSRKWELVINREAPRNEKERQYLDNSDTKALRRYMLAQSNDKETYARVQAEMVPQAFVSLGDGWVDMSQDKRFYEKWKDARRQYADDYVVVIDCHA